MSEQNQSTELVQIEPQQTALATAAPRGSSWGALVEKERVVKPRAIQLKNPKSTKLEGFSVNHFVDKEVNREWSEMRIVILRINLTRRLKDKYIPGKPITTYCRSYDRVTPITDDPELQPQHDNCEGCPFGNKAWSGYNRKTKTGKPTTFCEREANIFFIEETNPHQPYVYYLQGTNATPEVEKLVDKLLAISEDAASRPVEQGGTGGRYPEIYEYVVTMKVKLDQLGNPYPYFPEIEDMTDEDAARFGKAFQTLVVERREAYEASMREQDAAQQVEQDQQATQVVQPAQPAVRPAARPAPRPASVAAPASGQPAIRRAPAAAPAPPVARPAAPATSGAPKGEVIAPPARRATGVTSVRPIYQPPTVDAQVADNVDEITDDEIPF